MSADLVRVVLGHLADRVAGRLRAKQRAGRTVTVRVRFAGMRSVTRSRTVAEPVSATLTLTELAEALVHKALADHAGEHQISLLAISVSNLRDQPVLQLELPVLPDEAGRAGSPTGAGALGGRSLDGRGAPPLRASRRGVRVGGPVAARIGARRVPRAR